MIKKDKELEDGKELQKNILREKEKGTPDIEIGRKYGVTFKYIEKVITNSKGLNISSLKVSKKIKTLCPKDFKEEQTSIWSFKQRGNWATHSGEYRGNWSPYIPRNVILKYSKPGELVLDYFCGAGTTAVESKLLGRKCIAVDINENAIDLAKKNLNFQISEQRPLFENEKKPLKIYEPNLLVGDARNLKFLQDNSVDFICSHPPYANIIQYTDSKKGDLSFLDEDKFLEEMRKVAKESFRVLKPGRQCAILIGDMRQKRHVIPLGFELINVYLDTGFKLRELVIKRQHNCKTTGFWYANSIKYNFLLLAHEYLPIFEKPISPLPSYINDRGLDYSLIFPAIEKPPLKRKLKEFETTTVWILPEKDFEKQLNKNVIDRYSSQKKYSIITFVSHAENRGYSLEIKEKKELIFFKSPFLNNSTSREEIETYLQNLKGTLYKELSSVVNGGFIAIQTRDVRIDKFIEPIAKKLIDLLKYENDLWLREIVVVTTDKLNQKKDNSNDFLDIAHQYLIVYEVRRGGENGNERS
ncbi:MAG: hypothetical protein COZ65_00355 [Caldiserica bacterium CG_4_8_14_3_um_filter_35_18]|nr:MAG: hypothetical protein COZ65_00355 [Caldiserica bacterium CG_4_8_14_3_um_filter_35_18]